MTEVGSPADKFPGAFWEKCSFEEKGWNIVEIAGDYYHRTHVSLHSPDGSSYRYIDYRPALKLFEVNGLPEFDQSYYDPREKSEAEDVPSFLKAKIEDATYWRMSYTPLTGDTSSEDHL